MKNIFYVYTWTDPDTAIVFYVGKGRDNRAYRNHYAQRCSNKLARILDRGYNMNSVVSIISQNMTEDEALDLEVQLINEYKRLEDGGTLFNYKLERTPGGTATKLLTIEERAVAIELYENGHNAKDVGEYFGVHETTILRRLKLWGVTIRCSGTKRRVMDTMDIVLKYTAGMTVAQIAKLYSCSVPSILQILRSKDIYIRSAGSYNLKQLPVDADDRRNAIDDITHQYSIAKSNIFISAKKYNISVPSIRKILNGEII